MNCDNCKHYRWYYDRCDKWDCEVDSREVHNCFDPMDTPILDAMVKGTLDTKEDRKKHEEDYSFCQSTEMLSLRKEASTCI